MKIDEKRQLVAVAHCLHLAERHQRDALRRPAGYREAGERQPGEDSDRQQVVPGKPAFLLVEPRQGGTALASEGSGTGKVDGGSTPAGSTPAEDSPAELAARIERGDRRAEEELVERFGRGLMLSLDRHTGGRPEAEDLYQDTFCLAIEKLRRGELRDGSRLPAFLSQIGRNLAIDFYRKTRRRKTEADSEVADQASVVPPGQLGQMLQGEHAVVVRQVIDELRNERDRQLLMRFYIADEDKDAISADLGLSSLQFNRVLHRARQRYKVLYLKSGAAAARSVATVLLLCAIAQMFDQGATFGSLVSLR